MLYAAVRQYHRYLVRSDCAERHDPRTTKEYLDFLLNHMAHVQGSTAPPVDNVGPTNGATPFSSTSRSNSETPVNSDDEKPADRASVLVKDIAVIVPNPTITAATRKPNDIPGGDPTLDQSNEKDEHIAVDPAYPVNAEKSSAEIVAGADNEEEEQDDREYPGGFTLATLTFGLCLATFVIALDNTIIGMPSAFEADATVR